MRFINLLLGVIAALLAATAMGAIWSLFGLAGSGRASWMAVPSALALAAVLRFNNHPPGVVRAVLCLCLLALTIAYANWLIAAGFIAAQMGLGLLDAIRIIGLDMAYAVARAQNTALDLSWYGAALILAFGLGWAQPGEAPGRKVRKKRG
ncbi:MAG: hypothetical protein KDI60_10510 [Xanthomonadales bacterium]|nr:hypothetical protein [Xanthomonadales bacterium]MCP5474911.1 hypothetical protein [Rhodanobacteraceae bacterium]